LNYGEMKRGWAVLSIKLRGQFDKFTASSLCHEMLIFSKVGKEVIMAR